MPTSSADPLSIVVIGAHIDDHWFGMGGTLLRAARKGHRITVVQAVSTYCAWPVVTGRDAEIKPALARISQETGTTLVTLGHDYLRVSDGPDLTRQLAAAIAAAKADIVFCPWHEDSNQDHAALGNASHVAAMHGACFLPAGTPFAPPRQILQYALDLSAPSFRPDAFVDIGDVLFDLLRMNNVFDELYSTSPLWPNALKRMTVTDHHCGDRCVTVHAQGEFMLARALLRGALCGTRYADGFASYAYKRAPADRDLLARL